MLTGLFVGGAAVASVTGSEQDFDRYRVILERKPFGYVPPAPAPTPVPIPPSESFAKTLRMCAMLEMGEGEISVGLQDLQTKKDFFLLVGEISDDGVELVSADYDAETAVLRKGSETVQISLKQGDIQAVTPSGPPNSGGPPGMSGPPSGGPPPTRSRPSYSERRKAREEARRRRHTPPPPPKYTGEELQKHLEEYNMDLIRDGSAPPLPIPLTPQQDQQLVAEGVLPPM